MHSSVFTSRSASQRSCGSTASTSYPACSLSQTRSGCTRPQRQSGCKCAAFTGQVSLSGVLQALSRWPQNRRDSLSARSAAHAPWENDVVGLAQAMVDFGASVEDSFLEGFHVEKGGRRIITVQERAKVLQQLDGAYKIAAAGSLTNTLLALARLSSAAADTGEATPLRVAAASVSGCDTLGFFYRKQLGSAGVKMLTDPAPESHTGVCMVLTTQDANRTFLSYLGTNQELHLTPSVTAAVSKSRLLLIEGYLWEMPGAAHAIGQAIQLAKAGGAMVAMTAGDAAVVQRHRAELWHALRQGVDLFFMNRGEAAAMLDSPDLSAADAALALAPHCSMAAVTDGSKGSCICTLGRILTVPPFWTEQAPVDSCGAGDAYAAGLIWGLLSGLDPAAMGSCASRVASAVLSKHGAGLDDADAARLLGTLPSSACSASNLLQLTES